MEKYMLHYRGNKFGFGNAKLAEHAMFSQVYKPSYHLLIVGLTRAADGTASKMPIRLYETWRRHQKLQLSQRRQQC